MSTSSKWRGLRPRLILAACCFAAAWCAIGSHVSAADYFVRTNGSDDNPGTHINTAFLSIAKAALVAGSGDTVYVGAGTYTKPVFVLGAKTSSRATKFVADTNGRFTGDRGSVVLLNAPVRVAGSNGVEFDGFVFQGVNKFPLIWQDSFDGTVKNCTFTGGNKAVLMKSGSLTMDNCRLTGMTGDAIQVDGPAKFLVNGSTIDSNQGHGVNVRKNAYVMVDSSSMVNNAGDGVHVEVTADEIPIDDISDPGCECSEGTAPKQLKQQAYDILDGLDPDDPGYRQLIINAKNKLNTSLDNNLWRDDWHVNIPDGPGVYDTSQEVIEDLQEIYSNEVDFDIIGDELKVNHPFAANVQVLGAEISTSSYDVPVTVKVKIGGHTYYPWGSFNSPVSGNVNDNNNPRDWTASQTFDANDAITISGRSWVKRSSSYSGSQNSHWRIFMTVSSSSQSANLIVLRDGDAVPQVTGHGGQASAASFLQPYIDPDTGLLSLAANQAIFLFELGTTNLNSSAADFQDLVTLVTLQKVVTPLTEEELAAIQQAINLLSEADQSLAKCAINEASCANGDEDDLQDALDHYDDGQIDVANSDPDLASDDFRQAWEKAKESTGNQDVDSGASLIAKLRPAPPNNWIEITNPQLIVSGVTATGNANGLQMVTKQSFNSRNSNYSNNANWGVRLSGDIRMDNNTISGNSVGGVSLTDMNDSDVTVNSNTLADNTEYGLYAENSTLSFDASNMSDWAISGSQYAIVGVGSDLVFDNVTVSGGSQAAVRSFQGNMKATRTTFSGSGYGLAAEQSDVALYRCAFSSNSVGLYANANPSLLAEDSTFTGNSLWGASVYGGGSGTTFDGSTFRNNTGGLSVMNMSNGELSLTGGTQFRDNSDSGVHFENSNLTVSNPGGNSWSTLRNRYGVSSYRSTLTVSGVTMQDNTSYGVHCRDSNVTLTGCTVNGRWGIYADPANQSLTVNSSRFNGSNSGWGLVRYGGTTDVKNSVFDQFTGGMYLYSGSGNDRSTILNNTLSNIRYYGVYVYRGDATLQNTILTGSSNAWYGMLSVGRARLSHSHNLLSGFSQPHYGTSAHETEILKRPRFVNGSAGDFHLAKGSPAINSGANLSTVSTDFDGVARPRFRVHEIGAYEFDKPGGSVRIREWKEIRDRQ